jgi:hypothetical protein
MEVFSPGDTIRVELDLRDESGSPTLDVLPREAAENLGLDPSSPEYRAALDHLLALGDIEREAPPDPNLPEPELYRLTRQGLARVRELQELENYVGDSLAREQHHRGGGLSEEKG